MAKCVLCGKNVLVGGVKEGDARFCSQACRGTDFFGRFNAALEREASLNPDQVRAVPQSVPASTGEGEEPSVEPDPLVQGAGDLGIVGIGLFGVFAVVALIWFIYEMV